MASTRARTAYQKVMRLSRYVALGLGNMRSSRELVAELETLHAALVDAQVETDPHARRVFLGTVNDVINTVQTLDDVSKDRDVPEAIRRAVRSYMDRVFTTLLHGDWRSTITLATEVFEGFIRGITYFKSQEPDNASVHPLYHRLYSCGDGTHAFREAHLRCRAPHMTVRERNDVKTRIQTCYVERLIYDRIYTELSSRIALSRGAAGNAPRSQDEGHHRFIRESVERDFHTCFPGIRILVHVRFGDGGMPYECVITRMRIRASDPDEITATSTETYTRSLRLGDTGNAQLDLLRRLQYTDIVECRLLTHGGREFRKIQTFETGCQPWQFKARHDGPMPMGWDEWTSTNADASGHGAASIVDTYAPHRSTTRTSASTVSRSRSRRGT